MASQPHIVVFPFMAHGHTIPLLDLSKVLWCHGIRVTLITTPSNASFIRNSLSMYPQIRVIEIPFPHVHGLPQGCENMSQAPSKDILLIFLNATKLLREPFEKILEKMSQECDLPICMIADTFHGWTKMSCKSFGIPRLVFHGMGAFSMAVKKSLTLYPTHMDDKVVVKGVQTCFPLTKADLPKSLTNDDGISRFFLEAEYTDLGCWGVIVNSFLALEPNHVASLEALYGHGTKIWCVGPLMQYEFQMNEKDKEDENRSETVPAWAEWLNRHKCVGSVLYVSFGTETDFSNEQLDEVAHALVMSGQDFIWVAKQPNWEPPGDVACHDGRGLILRDWVDQRWVLAHKAIGGFLSHCGWNSVLESLSCGVPMLAWPMKAEQHLNAKFLAEELKVAMRVRLPCTRVEGGALVSRGVIYEGVKELMQGENGQKARERAEEIGRMAREAVKGNGSSYNSLNDLINQVKNLKSLKEKILE
ncbi:UDP-glucuronosyl/UDP-glucosyltransferase [Dillenia turbinata]|uniref:Glycosyltransferase n=1 Tax=Dillenia turbinata TaxID=194707 RepID=A0AAN8VEA5_9MAGN